MNTENNNLDPRIQRLDLQQNSQNPNPNPEHSHWETYEVMVQPKRGDAHTHAGSLHAPSPELALVFAKEQYGRRDKCFNMWVIPTAQIFAFNPSDSDMFANNIDKTYRNAGGFKVGEKISEYKKQLNSK